MSRFDSKVVIVTGGGSGIGRESALAFAREGAKVMVADVTEADARETVNQVVAAGGTAESFKVDVSISSQVDALVEQTVRSFGQLDVYFSNAGILDGLELAVRTSDELWNRVIAVNLSGFFFGARAAHPHLVKTGGNIVVTASVASLGGMGGGTAYTASKFGVAGLVKQLACEMAEQGVRVNGVAPGPVKTNIGKDTPRKPGHEEALMATVPMRRRGQTSEVASAALFLASSEASYITGAMLSVDGGWRAK